MKLLKIVINSFLLVCVTVTLANASGTNEKKMNGKMVDKKMITGNLSAPESVFYDRASNNIYVSNINGNPTAMDDNGYISIYSAERDLIKKILGASPVNEK